MTAAQNCGNCGATPSEEATFCKSCGAAVRSVDDMRCPTCDNDNLDDAEVCGGCGASLSAPPDTGPTPQEMDAAGQEGVRPVAIPEDAIVVRQSKWAYMLHTVPWVILFGVSLSVDFFTFGIIPAVFATWAIGSRYLSFRKTAYILTDQHIIIQRGLMMGQDSTDLPFDDLDDVSVRPGRLGVFLGYTRVELQLKDGQTAWLHYVPLASPLLEYPPLVAARKRVQ